MRVIKARPGNSTAADRLNALPELVALVGRISLRIQPGINPFKLVCLKADML